MKKIFFFLIIIIFIIIYKSNSKSDNDDNIMKYLKFEQQLILPEEINTNQNLILKYINDNVYILKLGIKLNTTKDKLVIYKINCNETKKINYSLPYDAWVFNFYIANHKLYILTQFFLFIYNLSDINAIYYNKIPLNLTYREIKIENDKIILLESCYSCTNSGTRAMVTDTNGNVIFNHNFKIPSGFQLSYYGPNNRFDYYKGKFIVSNILDYTITFFNEQFDSIYQLNRNIEILNQNKNLENIFDNKNYKEWVKENRFNDSLMNISRIEFSQFIDDSTIFICYSDKVKNQYLYDIWKYNKFNKSWDLFNQDLTNKPIIDKNQFISLDLIGLGILNSYQVSNSKILCIRSIALDLNKIDISKTTYKEFFEKNHEYYTKNDLRFSVFVYSIK